MIYYYKIQSFSVNGGLYDRKIKTSYGIDNFREVRTEGFYYVDKTRLMKTLMKNLEKVNLFMRPRRFGKTFNMSMPKNFFEMGSNDAIFNELEIAKQKELCEEYMGKFPVISITLKGAIGETFALKDAENAAFDDACKEALRQIYDRNYEEMLIDNGMKIIYKYGIACYKKRYKVISG